MNCVSRIITFVVAFLVVGCSSMSAINHIPTVNDNERVKLAVFLDGTANDEGSHTNIAKLHNLVTLQDDTHIRTSYIKGVGTDGKIIGMAMGWGIGQDVREAYLFIAENYNHQRGDQIYIFGFSRGAYAARILAGLIHVAGIPDVTKIEKNDRYSFIENLYDAYKGNDSFETKKARVKNILGYKPTSRDIEFVGLWDTVEALGVPDYEENWKVPNGRYDDQICNIKKAAHALSLDDNRARIFTPILLTDKHLTETCTNVLIDDVVDEVWFAGAHADVGGGYLDTDISGVSLNWMLKKISEYGLVPNNTKVYADHLDKTHDPESGLWGLIYRKRSRSLSSYARFNDYNGNKLKLHKSAIARLEQVGPEKHGYQWNNDEWFNGCFSTQGKVLKYIDESKCFTVVDY